LAFACLVLSVVIPAGDLLFVLPLPLSLLLPVLLVVIPAGDLLLARSSNSTRSLHFF
jgi:hypothetical protein